MKSYIGISIGPVVKTITMVRKPKELWSASYLFSYLAKKIINSLPEGCRLVSPAKSKDKLGIGLYPDRIYVECSDGFALNDAQEWMDAAWEDFNIGLNLNRDYFNVMVALCTEENDRDALSSLNARLDMLELNVFAQDEDRTENVMELLRKSSDSPLFVDGMDSGRFVVDTLAEIAASQLSAAENIWRSFTAAVQDEKYAGDPYSKLSHCKSYHKYFCVVQADGDNVGKALRTMDDDEIQAFSQALIDFGISAKALIDSYGGFPVYAGGDDLLFLAPVVGKDGRNVLELVDVLNSRSFSCVSDLSKDSAMSLSFGISICYYKHPLYEALNTARRLLDRAKDVDDKNAVSIRLEKHSGESFDVTFSKNVKGLWDLIKRLIETASDGNTVSAVAHKLRRSEFLLYDILEDPVGRALRLDAYFKNILESDGSPYFTSVKNLVPALYDALGKEGFAESIYSMLRIAKFIKGEEPRDE